MTIKTFRKLISPFFWGNVLLEAAKEHWIYLLIMIVIFNGSSLMRGEIIEFIISSTIISTGIAIIFCLWVVFIFCKKVLESSAFKVNSLSKSNKMLAREVLGVIEKEEKNIEAREISREPMDTGSKVGLFLILLVNICITLGIFYIWYLVANQ